MRATRRSIGALAAFSGLSTLAFAEAAESQATYQDVRVLQVGVHNQDDTNIEVWFDQQVCTSWQRYPEVAVIMADSGNASFLTSAIMAAFTLNRPLRVQTSNDQSCQLQAVEIHK